MGDARSHTIVYFVIEMKRLNKTISNNIDIKLNIIIGIDDIEILKVRNVFIQNKTRIIQFIFF